jgi:hypothetical protein
MKKNIIMLIAFQLLFLSCTDDNDIIGDNKVSKEFKITSFKSFENQIDINNDNITNSNMLLEIENYFNSADLETKEFDNEILISFYIPKQNIYYDYNCCPSGYVEFSKNGFTLLTNKDIVVEDVIIDEENRIINFSKISDLKYKLILQKKYFNFDLMQFDFVNFEILFELSN